MLKLIPMEHATETIKKNKSSARNGKKRIRMEKNAQPKTTDPFFVTIFRQVSHFVEKGKEYSASQIDDLIMQLQRMVLRLQKIKQELLVRHTVRFKKRKIK